ncbi:MAG: 4-hydroxy-tetrahydrodipicolinate reductase [Alphaproteobacteria bacterium]|nr:4-hydroxy-tetrahydrodipicolinate reductase [Alphaproteobacteria bacterium]
MKIGILGCAGRMGKMIAQQAAITSGFELIGGTVRPGSLHEGMNLNSVCEIKNDKNLILTSDITKISRLADVLIDFTHPQSLSNHLQIAAGTQTPIVVGTTGLTSDHYNLLMQTSQKIPIVSASNTSIGVALLNVAVDFMARILDPSYDIEIFEMHHRAKRDVPSGTAITLAHTVASARGQTLKPEACVARTGQRQEGEIGFAVARGGNIYGDVKVMFTDDNEMIELSHRALNRELFAKGALKAAQWVRHAAPGLYSMKDVLGLKNL